MGALLAFGVSVLGASGSATLGVGTWLAATFPTSGFNRTGGASFGGPARIAIEVENGLCEAIRRYIDGAATLDSIALPSLEVEALKEISITTQTHTNHWDSHRDDKRPLKTPNWLIQELSAGALQYFGQTVHGVAEKSPQPGKTLERRTYRGGRSLG